MPQCPIKFTMAHYFWSARAFTTPFSMPFKLSGTELMHISSMRLPAIDCMFAF